MEARIRELLFTFACINTMVILGSAVNITLFWNDPQLTVNILWQILASSFLCTLGNFIYPRKEMGKVQLRLREALHYAYINLVVLGCGLVFEWFFWDQLPMVLGMLLTIAVNFFVVRSILIYRDRKLANRLNERLKKYNQEKQ